jgi:hypothetical protein
MKTIIGALPLAARYCPGLENEDGFENIFDEVERGVFAIDTHENGLCVFAYQCHSGIRCALHSAALEIGLSPHLLKPSSCTLWPLVMRSPPDAALSICDDALQFPCNRKVKAGHISPELLDSLEKLLGVAASGQILKGAQAGHKRARIALPVPMRVWRESKVDSLHNEFGLAGPLGDAAMLYSLLWALETSPAQL